MKKILPHISIIAALMIAVFMVIDYFNRYIGFMNHWMTDIILVIWFISSIGSAILLIAAQRREYKRKLRREMKRQRERQSEYMR